MPTLIITLNLASLVLLAGAGALALFRMAQGPTSLDRSIASDVMIAVLLASVGLYTVFFRDGRGLPILVVLSLLGFTAAVGMARLLANRSDQIRVLRDARISERQLGDSRLDPWEESEDADNHAEAQGVDAAHAAEGGTEGGQR